jgi:hypothetical protein
MPDPVSEFFRPGSRSKRSRNEESPLVIKKTEDVIKGTTFSPLVVVGGGGIRRTLQSMVAFSVFGYYYLFY